MVKIKCWYFQIKLKVFFDFFYHYSSPINIPFEKEKKSERRRLKEVINKRKHIYWEYDYYVVQRKFHYASS